MTPSGAITQPIVRMVSISKSFTGTDAVRNVDLEFLSGEVHGLVGENGAGKSTLMRVLAGMYPDYSGEIFLNGRSTKIHSPRLARELGIAMVHQELQRSSIGAKLRKRLARFLPRLKPTCPLPRELTSSRLRSSSWSKLQRGF